MKVNPWRASVGLVIGLVVGLLLWWNAYDSSKGVFQNLGVIAVPAAIGVLIVDIRNRRRKVGHYDPDAIEENKRGRV